MIYPLAYVDPLVTIHPWSSEAVMGDASCQMIIGNVMSGTVSGAWPSANFAFFYPFSISRLITVQKMFWMNGTNVTGSGDIGIYDISGNKIVSSGSTAQSGASAMQLVSITATELTTGVYYMAMALNSSAGAIYRVTSTAFQPLEIAGCAGAFSSFPLPSSTTLGGMNFNYLPVFGLTTRTV